MTSPNKSMIRLLALSLGLLAALSGCMGIGFSPEAIAVQDARGKPNPDMQVDANSIQVLQNQAVGQSQIVLVSFQGMHARFGRQFCLFTYEVRKSKIGAWILASSGGSCTNQPPDPENLPVSVGGFTSGGEPNGAPGLCSVSGQVYRDDIQTIRVTWDDGTAQDATVINHSFLANRAGAFHMQKIEALDADQKVIYTNEPGVDPAKQQVEQNANPK